MYRFLVVLFLVKLVIVMIESEENSRSVRSCPNVRTSLAAVRKRRHLTFPDGCNIILTSQIVAAFLTHIPSGWNLAIEMDVLLPLPDANFTLAHAHRKKLLHRQKRDFWKRLEDVLSYHNLNGRACVLKSICEAKVFLAPPGKSLVHDILRAIYTSLVKICMKKQLVTLDLAPGKSLVHDILRAIYTYPDMDEEFQKEMEGSYDELLTPDVCDDIAYCPVSLLHFILLLKS